MTSKKTQTAYRRADTGTFTTEEYAKKHPSTTVKETNPTPKKSPSPKKS